MQISFDTNQHRTGTKAHMIEQQGVYGGALNYRKKKRPFRKNKAVHLILRSGQLTGSRSLLKNGRQKKIGKLLQDKAKQHGAKLYKYSVNSNHIHALIRFATRDLQTAFLRDLSGTMAKRIKRAFNIKELWDARPFTRIVRSKSFKAIESYIEKNQKEADGTWAYRPRPLSELEKFLNKFEARFSTA